MIELLKQFTTYQKVILTIYFIIGLPMIWVVPIMILMRRYLIEDKEFLKPEHRIELIVLSCSYMITCTLFGAGIFALLKCTS